MKNLKERIKEIIVPVDGDVHCYYYKNGNEWFYHGRSQDDIGGNREVYQNNDYDKQIVDEERLVSLEEFYQYMKKSIVKYYIELKREERRKKEKERKEREKRKRDKEIEDLKYSFGKWLSLNEGFYLDDWNQDLLKTFEKKFKSLDLEWTYVHVLKDLDPVDINIDFRSYLEEERESKLDRILNRLNLVDDGESDTLTNEYTSVKIDVYEDGFTIIGSTKDPKIRDVQLGLTIDY